MLKSDFTFNDKYSEYVLETNNMEVVIRESQMNNETLDFTQKVLKAYPEKIEEIAELLYQDDGIKIFFNNPSKADIIAKLNKPSLKIIDKDGILTYCKHNFDGEHIIDIEFDGVLEKFTYVGIDG